VRSTSVQEEKHKYVKINPLILLKNYYYVTALLMTLALGVWQALTCNFYAFILDHAGVNPEMVGVLSGYGSLLQVVCMFLFTRCFKKVPMPYLLIAGGLFTAAENIMYGLASNLGMMFVASTLWSVGVSARVSILPSYLYSLVPKQYAATAQTFNSTVLMMLTVVGNFIGGYLIADIGIVKYNYSIATMQLVFVAIFTMSLFVGKKVLKIKPPVIDEPAAIQAK
jgi:predicted MFS family arabinose efflux permease